MTENTNERTVTIYTIYNDDTLYYESDVPTKDNSVEECNYFNDYNEAISEIVDEIFEKYVFEDIKGYYEHKVRIKLVYEIDFSGECGRGYNVDYEYEIIESKKTDYWNDKEN